MIKVIDKQKRGKLAEGRNYQLGFAFLKKVSPTTFETVQPISPCKDFLNDVVLSEKTGYNVKVFGLNYSKQGIFNQSAFIVFKICDQGGSPYPDMADDIERLTKNYKNIQIILNYIENELGIKNKSVIYSLDKDNMYVVKLSLEWVETTFLISLYSLLIRMGQYYDGTTTVEEFLDKGDTKIEASLWASAKPKYQAILAEGRPKQYFSFYSKDPAGIHGMGILNLR